MSSPQNNRPASISLDQDQWFDQWLANDSTDGVGAAAPATAAASSPITAPNTDDQSWSKDHCNTTVPSRMDLLDNINLSRVPLLDHVLTNDIQTVGAQNLFGDVFGNVEWDTGFTPSDFINLQTLSFPINDQASDFAFGGPTLDPSSNNQTPDFVDTCQASRLPTHGQHPNILVNDRNPGTIYYENSGFNDIFHTSANSALVAECQLFSTHIDVQVATPIPCTLATNHVPQNRPNQYMQAILPKPPAFSPLQIVEPFQAGPSLMQRSWELNTTGKWIAPNEQGLAQSKNIVLKEIRNVAPSKVNKIYGPSIAKRAKKRQNAMLESYCFNFVSRPQPVSKKPARRKGVRSCLACNKNHLKCTGGFPCTNCQRVLDGAVAKRSRSSLLWTACFDSNITNLNIIMNGLSEKEQNSSVQLDMGQYQHLVKMAILLWDLAESNAENLVLEVIQERKSMPLMWYDSSPEARPGFRYTPLHGKNTPLPLSMFFTALLTQSSFLRMGLGITEEQFRWLTAQVSMIFFMKLKRCVTRLRDNRTTSEDKFQMLLGFTSLAAIAEQDLTQWLSCTKPDMCNNLKAYSQHFISRLETGLSDIETMYITSWTLLLRGIFRLDVTGRDHDSLGVEDHELLRVQAYRTVQTPCGVWISGVPYSMKLPWEG